MNKLKKTIFAVCMLVTINGVVFADRNESANTSATSVACSEWAEESVEEAINLNIINSGGNYNYPGAITRSGFCTMAYNLMKLCPKVEYDTEVNASAIITDTNSEEVYELVLFYLRSILFPPRTYLIFHRLYKLYNFRSLSLLV